jgi:hypothetical protein
VPFLGPLTFLIAQIRREKLFRAKFGRNRKEAASGASLTGLHLLRPDADGTMRANIA